MTYPRKGHADHLALGDHNVSCFQCGRKFKASEMLKHWQGYLVCRAHWEPRHPQDFVKAVQDNMGVKQSQPPADTYTLFCTPNGMTAIVGFAVVDCAVIEFISPLFDPNVSLL